MRYAIKNILKYVMMVFGMFLITGLIFAFRLFHYGYM